MTNNNPTLNDEVFERAQRDAGVASPPMTMAGFLTKTGVLFALLLATAGLGWTMPSGGALIGTLIGGFIVALVVSFVPKTAPYLAPVYALLEGYVVGAISLMFAKQYNGLVPIAILLTLGVFVSMYGLWATNIIRVTSTFVSVVLGATIGIAITYAFTLIGGMWLPGLNALPIYQSGAIGIAFSLFVVVVAALNLALDFQLVQTGIESRAPKYMEWYAGFGLMVTLVWLYISMLRLLGKLRN